MPATTTPAQIDKDEAARKMADIHFRIELYMERIFRMRAGPDAEADPNEPFKLLEVNAGTVPGPILPLYFAPSPEIGIPYPCAIADVTPDEFASIERGELALPRGWTLAEEYPKPTDIDEDA